ncbi:FMN-binding negative transcriptional regulator [Aquimarina sp. AD1]|uniref:FMN-binding negative transcriptional regulator n=1 Tax=Aquimarina sp. (strain AD1) TaxID=1714848 RepID=UPI000E4D8984|nr:FMN-binding negative transcriptional regulator [Aquimarina sp. AD1]AXT56425.1 FMN-binding negative transcriptional regulator [Aquimarina sp. AD1]RKN36808.1 FMN-binding negative transcriptional regulator [Aquimarina sp. AD1]
MYPPKHHQDYNLENIKSVATTYPFAILVSAQETKPFITHAPLIFHGDKLVGHIDANNPHISLLKDNYPITTVFQGPQTYISPSIYTTNQLPTWNYIIAHATGTVKEIKDPELIKKSMVIMTDFLENPDQNFKLSIEDPRMDRLIPYIHTFEIEVQDWEGKFKLSQDKIPEDIENAKQELIKNNQKSVADFVNGLFKKHF